MQIRHRTLGMKIFDSVNTTFMVFLIIVTLYPILHVVFASFSEPSQFVRHSGPVIRPLGFSLASYRAVFRNPNILNGYLNTFFIVLVGVSVNLVLTSIGAYFLSRKNVFFKNAVMFFIVFTMFFQGGLVPLFLQVRNLGLLNTRWALIFPVAINTFNMIIMRTYFLTIPESMEESAKIDGAGHVRILISVILPLSVPIIAVMLLYYSVQHWNSWFQAMIFLQDRALFPLQLILREILIANDVTTMTAGVTAGDQEQVGETIRFAVISVATLPILVVYPFLQKYFVQGIMIGAIKE